MPESRDLALQAIAGRTRLVAEQQFAVSAGQLADEAPDCLWRVVDLAEEADLALAALLGQGDRDLQLGGIQTDKHFAFLRHGSSLVREAWRRPIRNNPRSSHQGTSHLRRHRTYGLSLRFADELVGIGTKKLPIRP